MADRAPLGSNKPALKRMIAVNDFMVNISSSCCFGGPLVPPASFLRHSAMKGNAPRIRPGNAGFSRFVFDQQAIY